MADGIMFGALDSFESLDYFNSHRTGEIITKDRVYDLNFFAVLDTDAYESMVYDVGDRDLGALRAWLQNNAMIYDAQAAQGDKIVALSTCRDATTSGRLVIFATMTERVLLPMEVENYEAEYDAQSHSAADQIKVTLPEGTTVEYSVDGGLTWSKTPPTVENVMRDTQTQEVTALTVTVKAFHPDYGRAAEASFTMKVLPKQVTVTADPAGKIYGDDDPQPFTAKTEGTIGEDSVVIDSITRAEGEDDGTYPITPAGETEQGNYSVTFVPGSLTVSALTMNLTAIGYTGVYDGAVHSVTANVNVPDAIIEYSVNGGTWTTTPPSRLNFGTDTVTVRATRPGYTTVEQTVQLNITRRPVTVVVNNATKVIGTADPAFTYTVTGTIGNDTVAFTIGRAAGEAVGTYPITANGQAIQGNYIVTYVPGTLTITAAAGGGVNPPGPPNPDNPQPLPTQPPEPEEIVEEEPPLAQFVNGFRPTGGTHGEKAWALVNLICLLATIYLFVPLLHLKDKYGRIKQMKAFNAEKSALFDKPDLEEEERRERERILDTALAMKNLDNVRAALAEITGEDFANAVEELYYHVTVFARRFRLGFGLELVDVIAAIVAFVLTEDMRLPMVLIDKWTPLMLILLLICWVLDVRMMRYREETPAEEDTEEKEAQPV